MNECRPAAFTLIEVVVALAVMTGGIIAVSAGFSLSSRAMNDSLRWSQAHELAQQQLQNAMLVPAERLQGVKGSQGPYQWQLRYEEKPHGLVLAVVEVTWSLRGQQQKDTLEQLFLPTDQSQE